VILSIFSWLPTTYSNFYLTKILHVSAEVGMMATLIAILPPLLLKPIFGKTSDYFAHFSYLYMASILTIPLVLLGFYLLTHANIWGQIPLVIASCMFSAPVHAIMNKLFVIENRSRSINLFFISGACVGGLAPSALGMIVDQTGYHYFPAFFCIGIIVITGGFFYSSRKYDRK
jgi:MFS family permease